MFQLVELSGFNSKMVRLKGEGAYGLYLMFKEFQFQNGSIKSHDVLQNRRCAVVFQFQNGSIKRDIDDGTQYPGIWFQFQNGSIKRTGGTMSGPLTTQFQFQNGSIKRKKTRVQILVVISFNSKMVRLKVLLNSIF